MNNSKIERAFMILGMKGMRKLRGTGFNPTPTEDPKLRRSFKCIEAESHALIFKTMKAIDTLLSSYYQSCFPKEEIEESVKALNFWLDYKIPEIKSEEIKEHYLLILGPLLFKSSNKNDCEIKESIRIINDYLLTLDR